MKDGYDYEDDMEYNGDMDEDYDDDMDEEDYDVEDDLDVDRVPSSKIEWDWLENRLRKAINLFGLFSSYGCVNEVRKEFSEEFEDLLDYYNAMDQMARPGTPDSLSEKNEKLDLFMRDFVNACVDEVNKAIEKSKREFPTNHKLRQNRIARIHFNEKASWNYRGKILSAIATEIEDSREYRAYTNFIHKGAIIESNLMEDEWNYLENSDKQAHDIVAELQANSITMPAAQKFLDDKTLDKIFKKVAGFIDLDDKKRFQNPSSELMVDGIDEVYRELDEVMTNLLNACISKVNSAMDKMDRGIYADEFIGDHVTKIPKDETFTWAYRGRMLVLMADEIDQKMGRGTYTNAAIANRLFESRRKYRR